MGSTAQSTNLTPSTFAGGLTQGARLVFQAVTSSGAYFQVGDTSKVIIFVSNGSSSAQGAIYIEPGARYSGSRGQVPSTDITAYTTATAPIVITSSCHAKSDNTASFSTEGSFNAIGPFESATVKSSDGKIYLAASTLSTKMYAAVYLMEGGSS